MRSFSNAFITIQSNSFRISPVSFLGSTPRFAEIVGSASEVLSLALGRGASTSRTIRRISSSAAFPRVLRSTGVVPVSSS